MRMTGVVAEVSAAAISSNAAGLHHAFLPTHRFRSFPSPPPPFKRYPEFGATKLGTMADKSQSRSLMVRASSDPSDTPGRGPVSPVEFESPVGLLLAQILQTHPHLLPAAVDQQLENLQIERDAQKEENHPSEDFLYKRIAEVKEKERRKALEEIMYSLIVQKFSDNGISMIQKLSTQHPDPSGRVILPNQEEGYESVHSREAFELILSHIASVLGDRVSGPMESILEMRKVKLGKLYAASIMYGYFLKRVDERFQLERSMNTLPKDFREKRQKIDPNPGIRLWDPVLKIPSDDNGVEDDADSHAEDPLQSYVWYLDDETLQRYASIRSKEAISLIERQAQALFGSPDIRVLPDGSLDAANDEVISLTSAGLTLLILEAVSFGSFLWIAESYIETKYHFLSS